MCELKRFRTAKVKVVAIDVIRSVTHHFLLTTSVSCAVFDILSVISQKLQRSRDPEDIPLGSLSRQCQSAHQI